MKFPKFLFAERIWFSAKRALHVVVICTQRVAGGLAAHRGFGFGVGRVGWGHLCSRHWLPRVAVTARMPVGAYMLDGWLFLKRAHRRPARSTRGMGLPPMCSLCRASGQSLLGAERMLREYATSATYENTRSCIERCTRAWRHSCQGKFLFAAFAVCGGACASHRGGKPCNIMHIQVSSRTCWRPRSLHSGMARLVVVHCARQIYVLAVVGGMGALRQWRL